MAVRSKFTLPRSHGIYPGKMIRRSPFLNGDTKSFLGPGQQRWDYGQSWYVDQYTTEVIPYENPSDWPPVGSILAMPQIAFIGLEIGFDLLEIYGFTFSSDGYEAVLVPATLQEYLRLSRVIADVKSAIESVRFGKTYVINSIWTSTRYSNETPWFQPAPDEHYQSLGKTTSIVVPDSLYPDHIKTNLLNVSIGAALDVKDHPAAHPLWPYRFPFKTISDTLPEGSTIEQGLAWLLGYTHRDGTNPYQTSIDLMREKYEEFPRYGAKIYGTHAFSVEPNSSMEVEHGLTGHELADATRDAQERVLAYYEAVNRSFCQRIAEDLSEFGYSYEGESSLLDNDSLVKVIADHFGFDPDTGRDLS